MADPNVSTDMVVFQAAETELISNGKVNAAALKAKFGTGRFYEWRDALRERGIMIRPVPRAAGWYEIEPPDKSVRRAMDVDRRAIVHKSRARLERIVDVQKVPNLPEEVRLRLNSEEIIHGRIHQTIEKQLLKRRSKLPGIDD